MCLLLFEFLETFDEQAAGQIEVGDGKTVGGSFELHSVVLDSKDGDQPCSRLGCLGETVDHLRGQWGRFD